MQEKQQLLDLWAFHWPVMEVLIAGKSSIDLPELNVYSFDEATQFVESYGYRFESEEDQRRMHSLIVESLSFIEKFLMPREWRRGLRPPEGIMFCEDPRYLILWASSNDPEARDLKAWSCAILRVIHTIAHIEGVQRLVDINTAKHQIMSRFQDNVFRTETGELMLGDRSDHVALYKLEWKEQKTRESIILKLLHKQANVAETIYDFLGVRIITKRLCDVMLAVKFLRQFHMVTFPNCVPSRSRNTLVEMDRFKAQIEALREMLMVGSITTAEFTSMVDRLTGTEFPKQTSNLHSSTAYQSIQLTCRQRITCPNPQWRWIEKMQSAMTEGDISPKEAILLQQTIDLARDWSGDMGKINHSAFFPFEVQVMDQEAYSRVIRGEASHHRYKRSQIRAARRRVLHGVLKLYT